MTAEVRRTLAAYDLDVAAVRPLARGFNTTFRIDAAGGERFVLRVQRPDGPGRAAVEAEAAWLAALRRETELVVPAPVPTRDGRLIGPDDPPRLLYRWVEGRFFNAGLTPRHLRRVGGFMAHLHRHGARFAGAAARGRVDEVTTFSRTREDHLSPEVAARAAEVLDAVHPGGGPPVRAAIDRARAARETIPPDGFGLQHGDLHQENFLFHRGEVRAIDFDDCGHGPFVYDLAVTVRELIRRPGYPALRRALLDGYRDVRPLPVEQERLIDTYVALRRVVLMMWAVEHRAEPAFRDTWRSWVTHGLTALTTDDG